MMTKLLIAGFTKLAYMPYLNFYLEALENLPVEIHVVTWRRDSEKDITLKNDKIHVHEFAQEQVDEVAKLSKVGNFFRYRAFVTHLLKEEQFDRIIVLHTLPAVLIADKLIHTYSNRFILDYRDYTYEDYVPFKKTIGKLVKASYATFVSSDAFRVALPKVDKIYTSHNLLVDSLSFRDVRSTQSREHSPIRIAFWGFIRHEKINEEIIRKLGGDKRFELHYYGREQQTAFNLKALVEENGYKNIFFHGAYLPQDRYGFAEKTDLIHNMYENDAGTQKAMANKYYDGIVFRIPQLCTEGSYMGNRVSKENVGIALDPYDEEFASRIEEYYKKLDWKKFDTACDMAVERVVTEYEDGKKVICALTRE